MSVRSRGRWVAAAMAVALVVSAAPTGAQEPTKLKFWLETRGAPDKISDALADFTTQTGIQVERFDFEHDSVSNGLNKVIGTELFPDVFLQFTGKGLIGSILDAGQAEDLSRYYDQYGWDATLQPSGIALGTHDGVKHTVPFTTFGLGAWYNKAAFEKAGITEPPKTFDEFVVAMDKLVAAGVAPLSFGGKGVWDSMRLVDFLFEHFCGAETHDALYSLQADWTTTPCALTALTTYKEWVDKYMVKGWEGLDPAASQHYAPIFAGDAAMTFDPSWAGDNIKAAGQDTADYGVFALPSDTGRGYNFGEGLWISSSSQHKDEAAQLLDFLTSKDVQEKYGGQMRTVIPANINADFGADLDAFSKGFVDIVKSGVGSFLPADQAFPAKAMVDSFESNYEKISFGLETPEEAIAAIQADANAWKAQQ